MRGIGKGIREFKDAKEHVKNEIDAGMRERIIPLPRFRDRMFRGRKL